MGVALALARTGSADQARDAAKAAAAKVRIRYAEED
jgi:phosphoribosylglycinamide formyltransferase 2